MPDFGSVMRSKADVCQALAFKPTGRGVGLIASTPLLTAPNRCVEKFPECIHRLVRCRLVEFEVIA